MMTTARAQARKAMEPVLLAIHGADSEWATVNPDLLALHHRFADAASDIWEPILRETVGHLRDLHGADCDNECEISIALQRAEEALNATER